MRLWEGAVYACSGAIGLRVADGDWVGVAWFGFFGLVCFAAFAWTSRSGR